MMILTSLFGRPTAPRFMRALEVDAHRSERQRGVAQVKADRRATLLNADRSAASAILHEQDEDGRARQQLQLS